MRSYIYCNIYTLHATPNAANWNLVLVRRVLQALGTLGISKYLPLAKIRFCHEPWGRRRM